MSWSIGYDKKWKRDIGYGVPAFCDYPGCGLEIHRGLGFVCGGEPYGGGNGCGLYFCGAHLAAFAPLCLRCRTGLSPFKPTPDHPEWITHKLTDASWKQWRDENPEDVERLRAELPTVTQAD